MKIHFKDVYYYLLKIKKYGDFFNSLKLFVVFFVAFVAMDAINLPTIIISKFNALFFGIIFVGICVLLFIFLYQTHAFEMIKAKMINKSDTYIVLIILSCIAYVLLLNISPLFKWYKLIISITILITSIIAFFIRVIKNRTANINNDNKISNIYDLKDFIENNIEIDNKYPVLFAEKDVDYDLFDRTGVVNQLYSSLISCLGTSYSFVIGLEGPWGSGKTTIIKNVIKKIGEKSPDDFIIIDELDPWKYDTQQALLTSLFDNILDKTGIKFSNSTLKTISNNLINSIIGYNIAGNIAGNIVFQKNADEETKKLKEQICEYLKQTKKTIVVFVDNMDRATADNIIFLLKIINTVFDMNRVVFVLSYDKNRVNEILDRNLHINKHYIEKIIQQEICVPKLNRNKLRGVIGDCLHKLLNLYGLHKYKDFDYIIDFLAKYTSDIREFKRIMNSICSVLSSENKLYKPDLLTLEIIRFLAPVLYEEIHSNPIYYVSVDSKRNSELFVSSYEQEKFNKEGKEYFNALQEKYGKKYLTLLSNVFPYVDRFLKGYELKQMYQGDIDRVDQIKLNCGVASAKYFDLYFYFGENEYVMVSKSYSDFIDLILKEKKNDTLENIPELFDQLFNNLPIYYHREIIDKLWIERNNFDNDLNLPILIGLITNSQKIDKEAEFFGLSAYQRACAIMATLFSLLTDKEKADLIDYLKDYYKFINVYDSILYWLDSSILQYEKKEVDIELFKNMVIRMSDEIIHKPIDIYCDDNYGYHNSWALLRVKRKILKLEENADVEIIDYIKSIIKPTYIYKILRDMISMSIGTSGYEYYISEKSLKSFFDNENEIFEYIEQCPPSNKEEEFICRICDKYKNGEVDDWGNKAVYVDHYIRLW